MITDQDNKMAEEGHRAKSHYFSFILNNVIVFYSKQKQRVKNAFEVLEECLAPVISFFSFSYWLFWSVIYGFQYGFQTATSSTHYLMNFEYKQFFILLLEQSKECFCTAKKKLYQIVCVPIRRKFFRLRKWIRKKLLDMTIYLRGFCELCRRLFLLASDYTPGGKLTVTTVLFIAIILIGYEVYRYSRLILQVLDVTFFLMMFVLSPVLWTVRDFWSVITTVFDMLLSLLQHCCYFVWLCTEEMFAFLVRVLCGISSSIYKYILWFLNLRCVKFVWQWLLELGFIGLETFMFNIVPFVAELFYHLIDITAILSSYFYYYFVAVYSEEETGQDNWNIITVFTGLMVVISILITYRFRTRFPTVVCNEIEIDIKSPSRKRIKSTRNSKEVIEEVNFKLSSSAHICMEFLQGECNKGSQCDNHHCPWLYHWQYRVPVQGWKSFSKQDCNTIEKHYCNPINEIMKTCDINPDLSTMTQRSHLKGGKGIKLDFKDMRMDVSYHRLEIRRLSTESWVKCSDELATKWNWYYLTDQGEWSEYGNKTKPSMEDIEKSFIHRESSYNYKQSDQELCIYFMMTSMYERNMNPRDYKRRLVRRRPVYRSIDEW